MLNTIFSYLSKLLRARIVVSAMLFSVAALFVFFNFVTSVEAKICIRGDCFNQQQLHEFDKIQNIATPIPLSQGPSQGRRRLVRWPQGTYREANRYALCVKGNCITEWPAQIYDFNFKTNDYGAEYSDRYSYDVEYKVRGNVVPQDYCHRSYMGYINEPGVLPAYTTRSWYFAEGNNRTECLNLRYPPMSIEDAQRLGIYREGYTNYHWNEAGLFDCDDVYNRLGISDEINIDSKTKLEKLTDARPSNAYRGGPQDCRVRFKTVTGLEAVKTFTFQPFPAIPPTISYFQYSVSIGDLLNEKVKTGSTVNLRWSVGSGSGRTPAVVSIDQLSSQQNDQIKSKYDAFAGGVDVYPQETIKYTLRVSNAAGVATKDLFVPVISPAQVYGECMEDAMSRARDEANNDWVAKVGCFGLQYGAELGVKALTGGAPVVGDLVGGAV